MNQSIQDKIEQFKKISHHAKGQRKIRCWQIATNFR